MGWNGTYIDGINTKIAGDATGSIQRALGSSSKSQIELFNIEDSSTYDLGGAKDDRWARYRPIRSSVGSGNIQIPTIHARTNSAGINWRTTYGVNTAHAAYLGNSLEHNMTVSGTSCPFVTCCGLEVPIVKGVTSVSSTLRTTIVARIGQAGFNWQKSTYEAWGYRRAYDFDGYYPTARFPFYFRPDYRGPSGYYTDDTPNAILGHNPIQTDASFRINAADIAKYSFSDNLYWACIIEIDGNLSDILVSDTKVSTLGVPVSIPFPTNFLNGKAGKTGHIYCFGYDSTRGLAVLFPSGNGDDYTNPAPFSVSNFASADPLAHLDFDFTQEVCAEGSIAQNKINVPFYETGSTGGTWPVSNAYGIITGGSMIFRARFTNNTNTAITLNHNLIHFFLARFNSNSSTPISTPVNHQPDAIYNSSMQAISGSSTIAAGATLTVYYKINNIWLNIPATDPSVDYATSNCYAAHMVFQIKYNLGSYSGGYAPVDYPGGYVQFLANRSTNTSYTSKKSRSTSPYNLITSIVDY